MDDFFLDNLSESVRRLGLPDDEKDLNQIL
jgi:hypothetical protein